MNYDKLPNEIFGVSSGAAAGTAVGSVAGAITGGGFGSVIPLVGTVVGGFTGFMVAAYYCSQHDHDGNNNQDNK